MRNAKVLYTVDELFLSNKLHKVKYVFGLMLYFFGISLTGSAAPTDLDPTFGSGGIAMPTDFPSSSNGGLDMAVQADGKIVMTGNRSVVARFYPNGNPDPTFGNGGSVTLSFNGGNEALDSIAVQPDGKIVIVADSGMPSINYMSVVVTRLNADGTYDTTFDGDGRAIASFTVNGNPYATSSNVIKVAADGKIVVAGVMSNDSFVTWTTFVSRFNPDGSLDTTFDGDGKVADVPGRWNDITLQPDGTIVAVGQFMGPFSYSRMIAAKYNNNGSRAWSYNREANEYGLALFSVTAHPDGKFVAIGNVPHPSTYNSYIAAIRLNADGTLDNTFTEVLEHRGYSKSVVSQPDGKIIATFEGHSTADGFSLIRYNANGTLDTSFGDNGLFVISLGTDSPAYGRGLVVLPNGKYLVGGNKGARFTMVRYMGEAQSIPPKTMFDYDGDGKSDVSVFRPSENKWYILKSSDSSFVQSFFGSNGDILTPADYDGDGKTDIGIFRPSNGQWWYISSITGAPYVASWGQSGDIPRPSDWDGDGKVDFVLYRPSNGTWYRLLETGQSSQVSFGLSEDKPLIGDFDGDGRSDPAVYRPSTGVWWFAASSLSGAARAVEFGISTDIPVPADFDGDGKTDFVVYKPWDGMWHVLTNGTFNYTATQFGISTDKPIAADYDGDGKADKAVFRPSNGSWYTLRSTTGFSGVQWGISTDIPTPNAFVP